LKAVIISDERSTAQTLAQSQMEYVKSQDYSSVNAWSYTLTHNTTTAPGGWPSDWDWVWDADSPSLSEDYAGYCVKVEAGQVDEGTGEDEGIRKITITVYHNEDCTGDEVFTLEDYKVNR